MLSKRRWTCLLPASAALVCAVVGLLVSSASSEVLSLTTYYPAPYGTYDRLRGTQETYLAYQSGSVGIGTSQPGSKMSVSGNVAVGTSYDNRAAPANGMIVQGRVGMGVSNPNSNYWAVVNGRMGVTATGTALPYSTASGQRDDLYRLSVNAKGYFKNYLYLPVPGTCSRITYLSNGTHSCPGANQYATWWPGIFQEQMTIIPLQYPGSTPLNANGSFYCCNY